MIFSLSGATFNGLMAANMDNLLEAPTRQIDPNTILMWGSIIGGCAVVTLGIWLWLRRPRSYPFEERAEKINEALRDGSALEITYWSRRKRRFLHRLVTPVKLVRSRLHAYDHTTGNDRSFRVTRIKTIELAPGRTQHFGQPLKPRSPWRLAFRVGLPTAVVVLTALVLWRFKDEFLQRDERRLAAQTSIQQRVSALTGMYVENPGATNMPKLDGEWKLIVENDPINPMSYASGVLQYVFEYPAPEADKLILTVRTEGHGVVWSGDRQPADGYLRQLQDAKLTTRLDENP